MRSSTAHRLALAVVLSVCGAAAACATGIDGTGVVLLADGGVADSSPFVTDDGSSGDDMGFDATTMDGAPPGDDDDATTAGDATMSDASHETDAEVDAAEDAADAAHDAAADAALDAGADADASDASDAGDADAATADAGTCVVGGGFAAQGTACSDNGGVLCDGQGACTQTFTVVRVGTGAAALDGTATATYLDTYYPLASSMAVSTVALPTAAAGADQPLTLTGTSTTEGFATRSTDGAYLVLAGYAALPMGTITGATRVVGRVSATGVIDTTTTLPATAFAGSNVRSAASVDGAAFWVSGTSSSSSNGGIWYVPLAAATPGIQIDDSTNNMRALGIFAGQLYAATASGTASIYAIGSGLPTTTGQMSTQLPGLTTSGPGGFVLFDLDATVAGVDTLFVAELSTAGVQRWTFNGTTWTEDATFTPIGVSTIGVTGWTTPAGVTLIATTAGGVIERIDVPSATPDTTTVTAIATAATDTAYRGVTLAAH